MNPNEFEASVEPEFDGLVSSSGGEVSLRTSRSVIRHMAYANLPYELHHDFADIIADRYLDKLRDKRRSGLKKALDDVLDGCFPEQDGYLDPHPMFEMAYPLGRRDGADKTLRNWTRADFRHLDKTNRQGAQDYVASSVELSATVSRVIGFMDHHAAPAFSGVIRKNGRP